MTVKPSEKNGPAKAQTRHSALILVLSIIIPFGLGHFISYLFRTINILVYVELEKDLNLPASRLGLLTGMYFLMFAAAQIPVGVMLDRYGPRKVQVPMLVLAAVGSAIFSFSHSEVGLLIGRSLIGLGVAGSLMGAIKACTIWLPPERLPLSTACLLAIGGIGAMTSTWPLHELLKWVSWRDVFLLLAAVTLCISTIIHISAPRTYNTRQIRISDMLSELRQLYSSWSFWRLALYSVFAQAIYMAILSLWMGPWLRDIAAMNESNMASVLLWATAAMIAGSLAFGTITDRLRQYGVQPIMVCGTGVIIFVGFQLLMVSGLTISPYIIAVGFSFFGASAALNYAIIAQSVAPELSGRVSSSFNLVVFILAFSLQWLMGAILSLWPSEAGNYPIVAYQWSFGIMVALQLPGILLWFCFKPWGLKQAEGNF